MKKLPLHQGWEHIWSKGGDAKYSGAPQPQVAALAAHLKAQGRSRVLDLGCGSGRHLLSLASEGFDIWGCDVSASAMAASRQALVEAGLPATLVRAEMTALPFGLAAFDAVIAWDVVYHTTVEGIRLTVAGVHRSLREGGLFLTTFNSVASEARREARAAAGRGEGEELEPETYVVAGGPYDKALPHHYATEQEVRERFLRGFAVMSMEKYGSASGWKGARPWTVKWCVLAEKR